MMAAQSTPARVQGGGDTAIDLSRSRAGMLLPRSRTAQRCWAESELPERIRIVGKLRDSIAAEGLALCDLFPAELSRTRAESIAAETLPLADACKFLEREAKEILAPRRLSTRSRP